MRGTTRWGAALLSGVLVLAGCGGDDDAPQAIEPTSEPTETEPSEPEPEEPDEPEDPFAIPDDIDVAYVQSVVDEVLFVVDEPELEAYRTAPHSFPPDDLIAAVRAAYSPDARVEALTYYATTLADPAIAEARLGDLEGETIEGGWTVTELLQADAGCIVAAIEYPEGGNPDGGQAVLLAGYADADRDDLNPTPWVLDRHGPAAVLTEEEALERCDAEQLDEADDPVLPDEDATDGSGMPEDEA